MLDLIFIGLLVAFGIGGVWVLYGEVIESINRWENDDDSDY